MRLNKDLDQNLLIAAESQGTFPTMRSTLNGSSEEHVDCHCFALCGKTVKAPLMIYFRPGCTKSVWQRWDVVCSCVSKKNVFFPNLSPIFPYL